VLREIGLGLLAPLTGLWLLLRRPGLWLYALPPLLLGVAWSAVFLLERLALPELPAGEAWYLLALRWSAGALLTASVLLIQLLIALSAPLLDWLGEQTEEALGVLPRGRSFLRELLTLGFVVRGARALLEAIKLLGLKLVLLGLALPLGAIPAVGAALSYVVSGLATGLDFIDYPLARRHYPLSRKLAWARLHWGAALAFGVGVFGLLSVPVLAALMLPACVVGGTDLVFKLGPLEGEAAVRSQRGAAPHLAR
jgi:uncharacterized protein involved in cysteine biosynthesis